MKALDDKLKEETVFYITRDIERALGLQTKTSGYVIISNYSDFAKHLTGEKNDILLIKNDRLLDTWELLQQAEVEDKINQAAQAKIMIFKNTRQIEKICQEKGWQIINSSAELAERVEQKIPQTEWMGELKKYFPPYEVLECGKIEWKDKKFILQFNRSHTGSGTKLIETPQQLEEIKNKFPHRQAKIAKYIHGPLFTNNNVIWDKNILLGNISYQITGLPPFTDLPFATIGNDWSLPAKMMSAEQLQQYQEIARAVGKKLIQDGWRGLYGIDVVLEKETGKMYLVEINARQPASTSFEADLQQAVIQKKSDSALLTIFEAHLSSLLGVEYNNYKLAEIKDGAQIIQRVQKNANIQPSDLQKLKDLEVKVIKYSNTKPNADLLRIQSKQGIMSDHNKFNELGQKIIQAL